MSILVVPQIVNSCYCQSFLILVISAKGFLCAFNSRTLQKLKGLIQVIKKIDQVSLDDLNHPSSYICACYILSIRRSSLFPLLFKPGMALELVLTNKWSRSDALVRLKRTDSFYFLELEIHTLCC